MNIHLKFKTLHLDLSLHRRQPVLGVNSTLAANMHFLMWDFDSQHIRDVRQSLEHQQRLFRLPTIYFCQSSAPGNYHAYCLKRCTWSMLITVMVHNPYIDQEYVKLGFMRGYMTLRFTPKIDSTLIPLGNLWSEVPPDVQWDELLNFERYFTLVRKHHDNTR